MRNGLFLLIENFWAILAVIVISIVFFIIYERKNKLSEKYTQDEVNKKNLYLNRIDIIGNKVGTIITLIILLIAIGVYFLWM